MTPFQCFCVVVFFYCPIASGIILNPTVMSLDINKGISAQFFITNNTTEQLPLEVSVHQLMFETSGSYHSSPVPTRSLMVFPPAALVKPGQKQAFRVQWSGLDDLPASQSFFVRFSHIKLEPRAPAAHSSAPSVTTGSTHTGVNIQINYNALLHVYSQQQRAKVVLQMNDTGTATLSNRGNRFTYTNQLTFEGMEPALQSRLQTTIGDRFMAPSTMFIIEPGLTLPAGEYHGRENGL